MIRTHLMLKRDDHKMRLERCARLFGADAMHRFARAHVAVFGLGGVGSYAVEALARTGIGRFTLVDFDKVCPTNINRQLHALTKTVGRLKTELMEERISAINPAASVRACVEFYDKNTSESLLDPCPDLVLDCIDNVTSKIHLVATCLRRGIPVVTSLGSGAKKDPTRIRIVPLSETHTDPLGRVLRKYIRRHHKITNEQLATVTAIFSDEPVIMPIEDDIEKLADAGGDQAATPKQKKIIHGTAVFVTGVFGMTAASAAVNIILTRTASS